MGCGIKANLLETDPRQEIVTCELIRATTDPVRAARRPNREAYGYLTTAYNSRKR